ncbi:MAG: Membrane fusion protein multidrug efflux system [Verrucomicrobia bacterium]|nr:Membrane fusion protein multidrug efflux system [Verrucomicrobiota bacterium]
MPTATESSSPSAVSFPPANPLPHAAHGPARKHPVRRSRKPLRLAGFAIAGAALLLWIGRIALHAYRFIETDNAYVVGHFHQVSSQVDGQVREVLVQDNQTVKAGEPLMRLDSLEFEIAVQRAQAALAQAQAQEKEATAAAAQSRAVQAESRAKVAQAEAQIAQTQAQLNLARLTLGRSEQLLQNGGATTQADVDNARSATSAALANFNAATANRDAAQAAVDSSSAAVAAADAQIVAASASAAAAQGALRDAQRKLSYTTLAAPADGRIGNKNVEPGNRVLAGQTLLALVEPDVWVVANFKETQLPRMKVGQQVDLAVDALRNQPLHGTIESLAPASGSTFALLPPDNATGNFNKVVQRIPVKIVLDPASREAMSQLRLGYSVVVNVRAR